MCVELRVPYQNVVTLLGKNDARRVIVEHELFTPADSCYPCFYLPLFVERRAPYLNVVTLLGNNDARRVIVEHELYTPADKAAKGAGGKGGKKGGKAGKGNDLEAGVGRKEWRRGT